MSRLLARASNPVALILSLFALVVATSAGTAYAAIKIGTSNIKDGAVTSAKIRNGTVGGVDVRNGSLGLPDLSAAAEKGLRVRAYATVDSDEGPGNTPVFLPGRTRGFSAVTSPTPGTYCLRLASSSGINRDKVTVLIGAEYGTSAGDELEAYWQASPSDCPAKNIEVLTEQGGATSTSVTFTVVIP